MESDLNLEFRNRLIITGAAIKGKVDLCRCDFNGRMDGCTRGCSTSRRPFPSGNRNEMFDDSGNEPKRRNANVKPPFIRILYPAIFRITSNYILVTFTRLMNNSLACARLIAFVCFLPIARNANCVTRLISFPCNWP